MSQAHDERTRHALTPVYWALMILLFAAGVMNLVWVAAIAVFVLAEKEMPHGRWFSRCSGALFLVWGTYVLIASPLPT